ncbi:penicillin-binding transpeptidase domain-containing protein [uncultured Robinsoniella sp.]|uniref:penicillin-binding transpeptidase domain-containing protein n=3 Tax=Robinsoniella TaxID=588605 RepID=UPI00374E868E
MKKKNIVIIALLAVVLVGLIITAGFLYLKLQKTDQSGSILKQLTGKEEEPDKLLQKYMSCIEKSEYQTMYSMISEQSKGNYSEKYFTDRNQKIYQGMEAEDIRVSILDLTAEKGQVTVNFQQTMNSAAGEVQFENQAVFTREQDRGYVLEWSDSLIHPELTAKDKVRVSVVESRRGEITDRNGSMLAGEGTAASVGLVPGKMSEDGENDLVRLAKLLETSVESIKTKLDATWVKGDSLVPIAVLDKVQETDLMSGNLSDTVLENKAVQDELITIPGVMISDTVVRSYPLGAGASHLTGYVQNVTAEDLEQHPNEGYSENSVIGKSGMEGLYEKELKGQDGYEIVIENENGNTKAVIAAIPKKDGQDIRLTIDAGLQESLYQQFKDDKSCSVAMNPFTGEVLALVSTPSYDSNDFIKGMTDAKWKALNEDKRNPLYNRFRQAICPGSSFKPVIAGIGLETGAIDPDEDFGNEGLSWQKDESWGGYYVTTLHAYEPVILENAMIYSDNIYFAKAALKMGADQLEGQLDKLGFNQEMPFEITMAQSQYSNTDKIESEVLLADSGYGQGQILINPLHLAALYTAFCNDGNVIKPYLQYKDSREPQVWLPQAFSKEVADRVETAMEKVISSPEGTGRAAKMESTILAGKTGTAEIKADVSDTTGTELGWFGVLTPDPASSKPVLLISMVEDVKETGGSTYVVEKDKIVLDNYFSGE